MKCLKAHSHWFWFGIRSSVLSWLKSYLSSRCFRVKCENNLSSWYTSSCGVPQGSVFGSLINQIKSNLFALQQMSRIKHKERSEYVNRTQRQYETALTRALKIKTTLQHKFKFVNSMLETGYSRRSNNVIRKRIPRINNTVTEKMTVST